MQLKSREQVPSTWTLEEGVHHSFGQDADFHYHEVEEWLEVTQGAFSFYPAVDLVRPGMQPPGDPASEGQDSKIICKEKDVLHIPQGEVHRVEINDSAGVTYKMWTPIPSGSCFQRMLDPALKELVRRNLELPAVEDRYDKCKSTNSPLANADQEFLEDFVSPALTMHTKTGVILDKHGYLTRGAAPFIRSPSNSVEILHVTSQPESVLLSTVVTTTDIATSKTEQIVNIRLFVKENGGWKCRVWRNYPKP